jgi:hypothetical protein
MLTICIPDHFNTCAPALTLILDRFQTAAVKDKVHRFEYNAIETAPTHDGDKALLPSAASWERTPFGWIQPLQRFQCLSNDVAFTTTRVRLSNDVEGSVSLPTVTSSRASSQSRRRTVHSDFAWTIARSTCSSGRLLLKCRTRRSLPRPSWRATTVCWPTSKMPI